MSMLSIRNKQIIAIIPPAKSRPLPPQKIQAGFSYKREGYMAERQLSSRNERNMKAFVCLVFLALAASQAQGDQSLNELKEDLIVDLLKKINSPNDTQVQAETKDIIAEYLISSILEENGVSAFAKGHRDREREKERERNRDRNKHKPNKHQPHIDYRDQPTSAPVVAAVAPIINNPPPVNINNAGLNPNLPAAADAQLARTEIPVITGAPGAVGVPANPAPANPAPANPAPAAPVATNPPVTAAPTTTTPRITRPTVDPNHVYMQVDKILGNVATGNIVGIVDESLAIRAPTPVRNFVTGILKVIFCNPVDRIFGRCRPNSSGQISSVQGR